MPLAEASEIIDNDREATLARGEDPRTLTEQFAERLDAILHIDPSGTQLRFTHRPFHEALVAAHLAQLATADRRAELHQHSQDPRWRETLATYFRDPAATIDDVVVAFGGEPLRPARARLHNASFCARRSPSSCAISRRPCDQQSPHSSTRRHQETGRW